MAARRGTLAPLIGLLLVLSSPLHAELAANAATVGNPVHSDSAHRALSMQIIQPACELRTSEPPVRGELHEREWKNGSSTDNPDPKGPNKVWEFALEAGCNYKLWEREQIQECLKGVWIVIIGASQTNIWTTQLANTLAPGTLLTKRDHFSIDGVFTQMIDVVIRDGKVAYKKVARDPRSKENKRIASHTRERDEKVLGEVFSQIAGAPEYQDSDIRITNFFAEYWDNVDVALEAVEVHSNTWEKAEMTLAVTVGLWYVNSLGCAATSSWCATRPAYGTLSLDGLVDQFNKDMTPTLAKLEEFCTEDGRAGRRGCAVTSIDHCQFMQGAIWHKIYDSVKIAMKERGTRLLRFVDLWTLTLEIPEDCIGGHQSPMSTLWTWQVLLGGICPRFTPAEGTLARFEGPTCRSAEVNEQCPDPHQKGFHYKWECALAELCTLAAVPAPKSMSPIHIAAGMVSVDLVAAARVTDVSTWSTEYRRYASGYHWPIALATMLVAAGVYWAGNCGTTTDKADSKSKLYTPVDSGSPKVAPLASGNGDAANAVATGGTNGSGTPEARAANRDVEHQGDRKNGGGPRTIDPALAQREGAGGGGAPADKFSFGLARCIASLHVVAGHLSVKKAIVEIYLFDWGFTWVPWFFMLSGFILFSAEARSSRGESIFQYVMRRSVTIYPLYAVGLLLAFAIAKTQGTAPNAFILILQAFLGQAWVPVITERTLQMQCWFLSCLVVYWASFRPLFRVVSSLHLAGVALAMLAFFALPWLIVLVPTLAGDDLEWYRDHTFESQANTPVDVAVVFLKFHPLCYFHVFMLGMLLGRLRLLLERYSGRPGMRLVVEAMAPLGYLGLGLLFCVKSLRPPAQKLSARLSILLPLQSAILLGLAGLPGMEQPVLAQGAAHLNFLESYSYAVYVLQFICYSLWPTEQVGISFFLFLLSCAVITVHCVQKPAEKLWRKCPRIAWVAPIIVCVILVASSLLPDPERNADIPPILRLDDRMVDVRLPLELPDGDGAALINPSLLFQGDAVILAARKHKRSSARIRGTYDGKDVVVLQHTWHSEIVFGKLELDWKSWDQWITTGEAPTPPRLRPWTGLHTETGSRWAHLCVREDWIPANETLVRLVVTGPEDPKVFSRSPEKAGDQPFDVAFSSYPPKGRHGCGKDMAVSQMYLAEDVNARHPDTMTFGKWLQCGNQKRAEKNWIPFVRSGQLYFVYSVLPHVVMQAESGGKCGSRFYSNFAPLVRLQAARPGLAFRGSAQALYINDPKATPNLPTPHYLSLLHVVDTKTHRYAHFAYRFSPDPPFEILQVSSQLPLRAARAEDGGAGLAFVSSLAVLDRQVVISYSAGDRDSRALMLTMWRLDALFRDSGDGGAEVGV